MKNCEKNMRFLQFWVIFSWSFRSLHGEFFLTLNYDETEDDQSSSELPKPFVSIERESRRLMENGDVFERHSLRLSMMDIALQRSAHQGLDAMNELYTKIEPDLIKKGYFLEDNHPAALLSKFSSSDLDGSKPNAEKAAYAILSATKAFRKNYKYINDLARHAHAPKISLRHTALEGLCPPRDAPTCMPASRRYRTHDGTCNNHKRPRWGAAQMPFNRFLPPVYGDGVDSIRESVEGGPLASSRFVSLLVHGAKDGEAPLTIMIAQWGQLLDHDMTSTAQPRSINGSIPSCCGSNDFHPSCFPIKVPLDDPWLGPLNVRCLEFLRSAAAQRRDCMLSWREQTNQATSYIDASPIYSNHVKSSDIARVFRGGLLLYGRGNPSEDVCLRGAIASQCIRAGDGRSSEQPGLLAMHHVWVGEHNRIAIELGRLNHHWSDEKIYQETRRIVGAMFQHITYREFLPLILGREVCKLFELDLVPSGYYNGYDPKVNPTVGNAFAAAAFRFGHSLIQNSYMRCDRHHNIITNNISLHEEFQRGDIGSPGSLHRLLRGLATQRALRRDEFITPELTNHLFQTPGFPFGLDLAAINIQRGRDHGIPPYTSWRSPCGLSTVNGWDDFANVVGPESSQRIRQAYRSVHDIDLFVGGIAERPVVGGLVGPTFACIIAQQFSNSRKGDRFWYENGDLENSFTPAQLHALRRVSLAQILCRTVGGGSFQPHIFIPPGFTENQRLPCGKGPLTPIDLSAWQEQDPFLTQTQIPPTRTSQQNVQDPDRVFDIIPTDANSNLLTTVHIIKEEKVGFPNRGKPVENKTSATSVTSVDIPQNTLSGLHKAKNVTKINDKLDFKRKATTTRQPVRTHSIIGISNKLDQNKRIINLNGPIRRRNNSPTRRKVIVNNIPIELRNVENITVTNYKDTKKDSIGTEKTASIQTTDIPKQDTNITPAKTNKTPRPRLEQAEEDEPQGPVTMDIFVFHDIESDDFENFTEGIEDETTPKEFDSNSNKALNKRKRNRTETIDNDNDIDPLKRTEAGQTNIRVQRQLVKPKEVLKEIGLKTNNETQSQPLHKVSNIKQQFKRTTRFKLVATTSRTTVNKSFQYNLNLSNVTSTSTHRPKTKRTTLDNMELRHYQTRQSYPRPNKVIVKGPHSDQYEIEINIRQTSASIPKHPVTNNNGDYSGTSTNVYKPYGPTTEKYPPDVVDYSSTTSLYPYYRKPVTAPTQYTQKPRTKPPTIIYLNENDRDDHHLTTKPPGIFQSFLNFANNGLRPPTPISSIPTDQKERPTHSFPNSPISSIQPAHQYGSSGQSPFPAAIGSLSQIGGLQISNQNANQYGFPAQSPFPVAGESHSQTAANVLHASSSAVSTGSFGAIVGVATANAGDSTFSFNIRPKPVTSIGFSPSLPGYGNHHLTTLPPNSHYRPQYQEQSNSPFSSDKRPLMQGYYTRNPTNNGVFNENIDKDYDYSSRMLKPLLNLTSTLTREHDSLYNDDDDSNEDTKLVKKYDRDGYMRPAFSMKLGKNTKSNKTTNMTSDESTLSFQNQSVIRHFDLPKNDSPFANLILNLSSTLTGFNDSDSKNLKNDISAENDFTDKTTKPTINAKSCPKKNPMKTIAFAPIKILTNDERPDNWILYETPKNKPLLPDPPEVLSDLSEISEIPKPFNEQKKNDLGQEHREISVNLDGSRTVG